MIKYKYKYKNWTNNKLTSNECSMKNFARPSESLGKCCSRLCTALDRLTRESGSLAAKYKEMMGGSRLLHITVTVK